MRTLPRHGGYLDDAPARVQAQPAHEDGARRGRSVACTGAGTHKGSVGASQERSQGEPKKVRRARRRLQGHRRAHDYTGELVVE